MHCNPRVCGPNESTWLASPLSYILSRPTGLVLFILNVYLLLLNLKIFRIINKFVSNWRMHYASLLISGTASNMIRPSGPSKWKQGRMTASSSFRKAIWVLDWIWRYFALLEQMYKLYSSGSLKDQIKSIPFQGVLLSSTQSQVRTLDVNPVCPECIVSQYFQ